MRRNRFGSWVSLVCVFGGWAVLSQQGVSRGGGLQEVSVPAMSEPAANAGASRPPINFNQLDILRWYVRTGQPPSAWALNPLAWPLTGPISGYQTSAVKP
jgi:hypothetical protein